MPRHSRAEIYIVDLNPVIGSEIAKRRPCVIVSPDEMNACFRTVTIVPLTSTRKGYPNRIPVTFDGVAGEAATDQLRSVDKKRLIHFKGRLADDEALRLLEKLRAIFSH